MIALFGDLSLLEVLVIAALSVMIFGRDLPRVAAQAFSRFQKARRALREVWRESGIGEEVRQMQREIDRGADALKKSNPRQLARKAVRDLEAEVHSPFESSTSSAGPKPAVPPMANGEGNADAASGQAPRSTEGGPDHESLEESSGPAEPAGEVQRRPPWYPQLSDPHERVTREPESGTD